VPRRSPQVEIQFEIPEVWWDDEYAKYLLWLRGSNIDKVPSREGFYSVAEFLWGGQRETASTPSLQRSLSADSTVSVVA
jgi:hypothetical protein